MFSNDSTFTFSLLVNPSLSTLHTHLTQLLTASATGSLRHRGFFLNATLDANLNGDLNLQDGLFSYDDLSHLIQNELRDELARWKSPTASGAAASNPHFSLHLSQKCIDSNRAWKTVEKLHPGFFKVHSLSSKNSDSSVESISAAFERYFNKRTVDSLLEDSAFTGTLKSPRPALYIFPGLHGDSAYFSVDGFSMLVNGGYSRAQPVFWKFVNMFKQVDALLLTHADSDSLAGVSSLFAKKLAHPEPAEVKPHILSVLANLVPSVANADAKTDSDVILNAVDKLRIKLVPLVKSTENLIINASLAKQAHNLNKYEHVNLYYKLGYGSLDLYVLSPFQGSAEFKEFCTQQQGHFARNQSLKQIYKNMPSSHLASAVCLLVWLPMHRAPADGSAPLTAIRLLFTGNVPQGILGHALDKLKDFELLNAPTYRVRTHQQQETTGGSMNASSASSAAPKPKPKSASNVPTAAASTPATATNNSANSEHAASAKAAKTATKPPLRPSTSTSNASAAAAVDSSRAVAKEPKTSAAAAKRESIDQDNKHHSAAETTAKKTLPASRTSTSTLKSSASSTTTNIHNANAVKSSTSETNAARASLTEKAETPSAKPAVTAAAAAAAAAKAAASKPLATTKEPAAKSVKEQTAAAKRQVPAKAMPATAPGPKKTKVLSVSIENANDTDVVSSASATAASTEASESVAVEVASAPVAVEQVRLRISFMNTFHFLSGK